MNNLILKKLLDNLALELKYQKKLLTLLTTERNQIVHLRISDLDKIRSEKEDLLLTLSNNKDTRNEMLNPIKETLDPKEPFTLTSLFKNAPKEINTTFSTISDELKPIVLSVQKMNKENSSLLRQTLGLVSSSISIITARPTVDNTNYKKDGKVEGEQNSVASLGSVSSFNRSV